MTKLSYTRALNQALAAEMERDPAVFVLGEDVRHALTNVTVGLFDRFGPERIVETPLSEQGVTNFATGAAMAGLRPVVEYQIPFLLMLVFEQIVNQANKFSLMSGGQARVPVTYLLPAAGWRLRLGRAAFRRAVQPVRPLRRQDRGARYSLGRVRAARLGDQGRRPGGGVRPDRLAGDTPGRGARRPGAGAARHRAGSPGGARRDGRRDRAPGV